ncbi:MAG: Holliday junction branch migration protein RuvA [Oscillospiraceae bacterium]|nr:Holliday junction branch migration protein RuvA [Oscillospiraceae bacterium]
MFYYLEGTVAHLEPYVAVIDCGGVGYLCHVSTISQAKLKLGQKARVYTHLYVREDAMEIYGFADLEEKNCFLLLTSISSIGMKVALSILSTLTPAALAMAVINEDERAIVAVPGIGKKLAQRIILELKDKLKKSMPDVIRSEDFDVPLPAAGSNIDEAVAALQVLGYSASEASAALRGAKPDTSVEDLIRLALNHLSR